MHKKESINKAKTHKKKKLIRTQREKNRTKIIITVVIILLAAIVYYLIDSGSYVATVDGHRISKTVYQFFLQKQMSAAEVEEGLVTQEEKDKFWTTIADGQDPYEAAKREALNYSKEFMIQYIKAQESGMKIDSEIKEQIAAIMPSIQGELTEKQFKEAYKTTVAELQGIYEMFSVIEKYKRKYLDENYQPEAYTDEQLKAEYNTDAKLYDKIDVSYVTLYKFNETGTPLSEEEIAGKKEKAEEALKKIQEGGSMDEIISEYTEDKADSSQEGDGASVPGKASITYSQDSMYEYYLEWDFIEWAFDNKPGDTDIIETNYFIYVAKIDGRTTFDDVKDIVKSTMEFKAGEEFYNNVIESWGLEPKYNIIKNDRVYDSISYK
ncbi:MAG: peptidylprolyl isomerase [Acetivibrionales bacterium]